VTASLSASLLCSLTGAKKATVHEGTTAWQAYKDALSSCESLECLFRELANETIFVAYWDFECGGSAWEFDLGQL
jgi:hypothetical protein